MKFFPFKTEFIYTGQPYLYNNNHNEIYFDSSCHGDAVVQFGDWGQELNVDSQVKTIVSFEAVFSQQEIKRVNLSIPEFTDAKITVDVIKNMDRMKIYYDDRSGWFCFGNRNFYGKGYRFATDTIAVIHNNNLEAIFICPQKTDSFRYRK